MKIVLIVNDENITLKVLCSISTISDDILNKVIKYANDTTDYYFNSFERDNNGNLVSWCAIWYYYNVRLLIVDVPNKEIK